MNFQAFFDYIVARLGEKSTWIALGMVATALGWRISPENWNAIATVIMVLAGGVGAGLPARVSESNVKPVAEPTALSNSIAEKTQ